MFTATNTVNTTARGALKPFKFNSNMLDAVEKIIAPVTKDATYPTVPASSSRWMRVHSVNFKCVPFTGHGDRIMPYFGWLLEIYGIEAVDIESESGCYTVLYAYNDTEWRRDIESRMYVLFRAHGKEDFAVLDGYDVFMPEDAEAAVMTQSSAWIELENLKGVAAMAELFHMAEGYQTYQLVQDAWSKKQDALNYYHDADRGPWDPKR